MWAAQQQLLIAGLRERVGTFLLFSLYVLGQPLSCPFDANGKINQPYYNAMI